MSCIILRSIDERVRRQPLRGREASDVIKKNYFVEPKWNEKAEHRFNIMKTCQL
jgi:hypothetical protein